ncbi:MAG: phosphatidate cytidylyltransferase [Oscillospiraceae bacterium]
MSCWRRTRKLQFSALSVALFGGFVYPFLLGALVRLRGMQDGAALIFMPLPGLHGRDSGAYFVGRACGKHKLAPVISPKKTVEGAIGGVVTTVLFVALLYGCC